MRGLTLFLREAITNPSKMGALFPSSKRLANTLAKKIPIEGAGLIIELGAGTGAITDSLLHRKNTRQDLIVIERSINLANHLIQRFPNVKVIQGDAGHLNQLLDSVSMPIQAIVSSLPLRTLSPNIIEKIGHELNQVLQVGGLFIQYTYSLWGPPLAPSPHLKLIDRQWVWRNLPPARIDVFCRQ